jgi:hypothetical protein
MDGETITSPSDSKHCNSHSNDGLLMVLYDIRFELENPKCVLIFESDTYEYNLTPFILYWWVT